MGKLRAPFLINYETGQTDPGTLKREKQFDALLRLCLSTFLPSFSFYISSSTSFVLLWKDNNEKRMENPY